MRHFSAWLMLAAVASFPPALNASDMIADGGFDKGKDAFWASGGVTLSRTKGKLCAAVAAGGQPWEQLLGVNDIKLQPGKSYALSLSFEGSIETAVPVFVQRNAPPWTAQARFDVPVKRTVSGASFNFRATDAEPAQIIFQLGGAARAWTFCLDSVGLQQAAAADPSDGLSAEASVSVPFVNQSGYLLAGPKRATILSDSPVPLAFELLDASGRIVGKGTTAPSGYDATVGRKTHIADFTAFAVAGTGYRLRIEGQESYPFSIGHDVYGMLRIDALSWFYPQRSGIEIRGDIAGQPYARPAGHVGQSPNGGDTDVGCLSGAAAKALYGDWSCNYRLDVSGGWYDAGDQGKYVVNGAVAAAQLMGTFERGLRYGGGASPVMSDSLSRIPENGNGVPDILDEARWELEFLLKMVVPDGQKLAGMVHHKVHDTKWTSLPMLPHLDPEARALHRPSTAATLDMAAAAAQGSRLFAPYDAAFSSALLAAAEKSFLAAAANPVLRAPLSDGQQGGGDYDDDEIGDETYWAAAELYLTTGKAQYLSAMRTSPHWAGDVFSPAGAFHWRNVAGLARLDLALYGVDLPVEDKEMIRQSVVAAGRQFLALQKAEPFGHIYRPAGDTYDWGSNQMILQNMIVMSAAYDLSSDPALLAGVRESMDYILGRNAMNMSYVTGYGSVWSKNQHSRWYAHQIDPSLPNPPIGSLAGGPNATLVDEVSKARLAGCKPQTCYVDDIMAWGVNEIAVNWNAPLVYVASFLADAR